MKNICEAFLKMKGITGHLSQVFTVTVSFQIVIILLQDGRVERRRSGADGEETE